MNFTKIELLSMNIQALVRKYFDELYSNGILGGIFLKKLNSFAELSNQYKSDLDDDEFNKFTKIIENIERCFEKDNADQNKIIELIQKINLKPFKLRVLMYC